MVVELSVVRQKYQALLAVIAEDRDAVAGDPSLGRTWTCR